ncbi:MAG: PorP/SprF family type IX secretion system membrane protein [Bacteroidota bacterium]
MIKFVISILFFLLLSYSYAQHTQLLSQYTLNGLPSNPAYTGSYNVLSVSSSYRNQWVGFEGSPATNTISVHTPLKKENIAVGLLFYRDVIGKSYDNGIFGSYAYRFKLWNGKLSLGLNAGISLMQARLSEAIVINNADPVYSQNTPVSIIPNFSFGSFYCADDYYLGFSIPYILSHQLNENIGKFNVRHSFKEYNFLLTGGYNYIVNSEYCFKPSMLFRMNMTTGAQLELTAAADYKDIFGAGFSFRTSDAVIAFIKVNINSQFTFAYSYDFTVSRLRAFNSGSHELFLLYRFRYVSKSVSARFL